MMSRKGYKGFEKGLICREKQYRENEIFTEEKAEPCKCGMHYTENPFDVLNYYPLVNEKGEFNDFAEVESLAEPLTDDGKKFCTTQLKIGARLSFAGFVQACVDFVVEKTKFEFPKADMDSGNSAQIGSSGDSAQIGSSGYSARIGSSGDSAQIGSSGILPRSEAPVILPRSEAPVILPGSEAPVILPRSEAPVIMPGSEAPGILPRSEAPGILPRSEAPGILPGSEAPVIMPGLIAQVKALLFVAPVMVLP